MPSRRELVGQAAHRVGGIGQIHQHESADDRVERAMRLGLPAVARNEGDVVQAGRLRSVERCPQDLRLDV